MLGLLRTAHTVRDEATWILTQFLELLDDVVLSYIPTKLAAQLATRNGKVGAVVFGVYLNAQGDGLCNHDVGPRLGWFDYLRSSMLSITLCVCTHVIES